MTRSTWYLAGIVALAIVVAWLIRFGTDDAYITFVYSRSLVRGDGLTWFGEHIEGYTNFAWALWVALGLKLGLDPLHWAWVGSLAALGVTLVVAYRLAVLLLGTTIAGLWVVAALATNFTFLAFGTSGLETMLQSALVTAAVLQLERMRAGEAPPTPLRLGALSLTCAFALWTRLDSAVICAPVGIALAALLVRQRAPVKAWASAIGPVLVVVGSWLAWKLAYYGDLVPNTFHAKIGWSSAAVAQGARYVAAFGHSYLLWPFVLVALIALRWRRPRSWLPHLIVAAWLIYVIAVGGDFMEFRFLVPVLPVALIAIADVFSADVAARSVPKPWLRAGASLAILAAFSWRHAATFRGAPDRTYDAINSMGTYYGLVPDGDWGLVGRALHATLAGTDATIAINGAGAIPYFADVPTIDQLGLNDAWVARNGVRPPSDFPRAGHQRYATYDYLVRKRVTFVIGSPVVIARGDLSKPNIALPRARWLLSFLTYAVQRVPSLVVVAAPLTEESALLLWYLTPTPEITERIKQAGWEIRDLISLGSPDSRAD